MKILKFLFVTLALLAVGGFLITSFVERSDSDKNKSKNPEGKPEDKQDDKEEKPKGSGIREPYVVHSTFVEDAKVVE